MLIRKLFLFLLSLLQLSFSLKAQQKDEYLHPKFDSITKLHRSIAILPFDVLLNFRAVEKIQINESDLQSLQRREGGMIQKTLDAFLFKKTIKKKVGIEIQDIDSTNSLFRKSKWTKDSIIQRSMKDIAALLGVDAILYGSFKTNRPVSREVSTAFYNLTRLDLLPTISGDCVVYLYDGTSGELLWKDKKGFEGGSSVTIDVFFEPLMRRVSRRLPYY